MTPAYAASSSATLESSVAVKSKGRMARSSHGRGGSDGRTSIQATAAPAASAPTVKSWVRRTYLRVRVRQRACRNAAAFGHRSAGSKASARRSTGASAWGTPRTSGRSPLVASHRCAVSASYTTMPAAYTSVRTDTAPPAACSGAM